MIIHKEPVLDFRLINKFNMFRTLVIFLACLEGIALAEGIHDEIEKAQVKILKFKAVSGNDLNKCYKSLIETQKHLTQSSNNFRKEAESSIKLKSEEIKKFAEKITGEAIDKKKEINSFKCILKTIVDANTFFGTSFKALDECLNKVKEKPSEELIDSVNEHRLIGSSALGLYDELTKNVKNCESTDCIQRFLTVAEERQKNVKNLMKMYEIKSAEVGVQYDQEAKACINKFNDEMIFGVLNHKNKMKSC